MVVIGTTSIPHVVRPGEGHSIEMGGLGVRYMATSADVAIVEHPLAPRTLGAPVHTHRLEDEYSYVTEGRVSVEIDGHVVVAETGDLVIKPRGIPHAFWNETDEPARLVEVIAPGGFERYFEEIQPLFPKDAPPDLEAFAEVADRYGLTFDFESVERITRDHGLVDR
jgi:mannose-6-phosphate isomerase-like protein (cupin superfamily)